MGLQQLIKGFRMSGAQGDLADDREGLHQSDQIGSYRGCLKVCFFDGDRCRGRHV